MTLFRALSLLAPLAAAGCLGSPDAGSAVRFGAAVGRTFGAGRNDVDAEGPALANVAAELSEAWSTSGFLEFVVPDESFDLHLRTIRAESLHAHIGSLVEIVRGEKTSEETVARAFDFVKAIRKTPIVVKDAWGFYAARVRNTYILEGITLLQEGYPPALIENLGMQAGMPVGALQLADDLSLKLVRKYESQAAELYGPRYIQHPAVEVLEKMLGELDRPGGKSRRGFYEAEENEERSLWSGLTEHFPVARRIPDARELPERFLFAQVLEAIWCLQEKVIGSVPEANLGSIYGWGFPGFKGGVVQYIADYGLQPFLKRCKELEKKHGPRFKAPGLLTKDPGRLLAASDGIKAK